MNIISITCAEIESAVGFVYGTLPLILNLTHTDCEQSWYSEDGRLLADPADPETLMAPVISVSSDGLVSSLCVNLSHEIICPSERFRYQTLFRVRNETAATLNSDVLDEVTQSLQFSDHWCILALFIIVLAFLCFILRKRIFSCVSRAVARIFQCDDSENRDPESADQMKLGSDESDSLNQSESEQLNDSLPRG